jgi:hypothetical protein
VSTEFYWLAVAAVTIISASRLTRLATVDKFPPTAWVRHKYSDATDENDWWWLMNCGYCFSFWATLLVVVWGYLSDVYSTTGPGDIWFAIWWLINGVLAAAYLAAWFMAHDGDDGDDN